MRQQAWLEKINTQAQEAPTLLTAWKTIPDEYKLRTKIATAGARAFYQLGDSKTARQILTDSLNSQWDSDLVKLYGESLSGEVINQIDQAERWLKEHSNDAGLLLVLGKLCCLHQGLWGKAQSYLEASASVAPSIAAYTILGQLSEKLQKPNDAFGFFQKAMGLVTGIKGGERRMGLGD
ncbi:MAG: hypothetical protein WDM70_00525 [Nitrosomonadales bacterium]